MIHGAGRAAALALLLMTGACKGGSDGNAAAGNAADDVVITGGGTVPGSTELVSTGPDAATLNAAATPMAERVAVIGVLNKHNGQTRDLTLKPGQAVRLGDLIVRLRACDRTAPWEQEPLTGAFVQLDLQQPDKSWRRVFSGWLFKERPAANVVQNPLYDVWPKSCEMTFRDSGDETLPAPAVTGGGSSRSSAKKSAEESEGGEEGAEEVVPSAAPSNAM